MRYSSSRHGFTIIELLISITIISLLAAVLIPNVARARQASVNSASAFYARNVAQWAGAWLLADSSRRVTDLSPSCVDITYVAEGAPEEVPVASISCEVLIEPNGPGTFGVRTTSPSGEVFEVFL
jgi:prepilin-type N-terminal cleavage/methylation domain-containing protein